MFILVALLVLLLTGCGLQGILKVPSKFESFYKPASEIAESAAGKTVDPAAGRAGGPAIDRGVEPANSQVIKPVAGRKVKPALQDLDQEAQQARSHLDGLYAGDAYNKALVQGVCTAMNQTTEHAKKYADPEIRNTTLETLTFRDFLVDYLEAYVKDLAKDAFFRYSRMEAVGRVDNFLEAIKLQQGLNQDVKQRVPPAVLRAYFQACVFGR